MTQKPTKKIKDGLDELIEYNERVGGGEVGSMYLGEHIFVAEIKHPRVINGEWEDMDKTVDMTDLIDMHQRERGW